MTSIKTINEIIGLLTDTDRERCDEGVQKFIKCIISELKDHQLPPNSIVYTYFQMSPKSIELINVLRTIESVWSTWMHQTLTFTGSRNGG